MTLIVKFYYSTCTQCGFFNLYRVQWLECISDLKFLPHQMYQWVRNILKFHLSTWYIYIYIFFFFNIFTFKEVDQLALFEPMCSRLLKFDVHNFKLWTNYCLLVCNNSLCIWNIFHLYFFLPHFTKYLSKQLHSFIFHKMLCGAGLMLSVI